LSDILWKRALQPPPGEGAVYEAYGFSVPNVLCLEAGDEQIVKLPESRAYQVLSRSGIMLAAVGLDCREALRPYLEKDRFRVGLYCATEKGPGDYDVTFKLLDAPPEQFASIYRLNRSPKRFFKEIANIPVAQLGIFLGINGPHVALSTTRWGTRQALEQAECDLADGTVDAALVCSAFAVDDPARALRWRRLIPSDCTLCEGAAALVLVPNGECTDWGEVGPSYNGRNYGIAHGLIQLINKRECVLSEPK